jgi:hypothetical protein
MYCTGDATGDMSCSVGGGPVGGPTYAGCAADGFEQTSGPNDCYTMSGGSWTFTKPAAPPPCQDDWGKVDQTLESLGSNVISLAKKDVSGINSQELSALSATIHLT